jgi:two-component system chemotaxis response regulator CheB
LPREPARLIGIGASAGGIDALLKVVRGLPRDLPHAIFVVLHLPATGSSVLAEILDRKCALTVGTAAHGERIARGRIYCAPPDSHVEVRAGWIVLSRGPKENGVRPAADVTRRTCGGCARTRPSTTTSSRVWDEHGPHGHVGARYPAARALSTCVVGMRPRAASDRSTARHIRSRADPALWTAARARA